MRVQLSDIIDGMDMQSDDLHPYLHRPTGRVITISDEAFAAAESDDDDSAGAAELTEARAILAGEGEYLELPDRFEINEYGMMERFALHLTDRGAQEAVLAAIRGRGAFRYFKDTVHRLGLAASWYAYRDEQYREVAREWCAANGIEYDDGARRADG